MRLMKTRTWPILTAGFGSLLALIVLFGVSAARRVEQIQAEVDAVHETFQSAEHTLSDLHSDFYLASLMVRDFLLDSSRQSAAAQRQELLEIRASIGKRLKQLEQSVSPEERGLLERLHSEIDIYWEVLDPIFEWTPMQKLGLSAAFLRHQVLPRRQGVLSISQEIRDFNKANFQREQNKIQSNRQELRRYLVKMAALSLSLGLLVAVVSIVRISRLERWTDEQRRLSELTGEELRRLSQQLVRAQEDERRTLSRELHDEVGQLLTALRMELGNLDQLRNGAGPQFQQHLEEARGLAGQALQEVRNLAMGLRPSMLDDLGLVPALEWQAREFSRRSGVPVHVQADGHFEGLPETTRTCVFRIVQEALTNCARHSGARSIHVELQAGPADLSVRVEDDGVGFQQESVAGQGLGLRGIEERVRELGGRFQILSQPRQGAVLQAEIPLPEEVSS